MKIRTGFVSNSSSTSFSMYGIRIRDPKQLTEKFNLNPDTLDDLYFLFEGDDISVFDVEYDGIYIGGVLGGEREHSPMSSAMRNDETLNQFKQRIKETLEKKLNTTNLECENLAASWYNG